MNSLVFLLYIDTKGKYYFIHFSVTYRAYVHMSVHWIVVQDVIIAGVTMFEALHLCGYVIV